MPESCSDLGAEGQVTEEMVDAFMEARGLHLQHHSRARHRRSLEAALPLSPLTRRVEELEAALRGVLECVDEAQAVDIGVMNLFGGEPLVIQKARALLKDGER